MFPFEVSLSSKSLDHTGHHRENTSLTVQVWKMVIKVKIITRAEFNLLTSHTSGGSVFFQAFYAEKRKWTALSKVYTHV